jgi:hypothetical protein
MPSNAPPLRIGADVQAWAAFLDSLSVPANAGFVLRSGNVASSAPFNKINNANGIAYQIGNLQIAFGNLTMTFNNTASLSTVWTFPAAFLATPTIIGVPRESTNAGSFVRWSALHTLQGTTTSVAFRLGRSSIDFTPTDTLGLAAIAIGEWQ